MFSNELSYARLDPVVADSLQPSGEEKLMYNLDQASGQVVAADMQSSVAAIDVAVLSYARLCCSIVEVSGSSDLPVSAAQKALRSTVSGLNALIASREEIATATRELVKIQKASTLEPVSFGCPGGLPTQTTGKADKAFFAAEG